MDSAHKATRSVLVVDDQADLRTFLRIAVEQAGYEIQEVCNGKEAMDVIRQTPCDAVLTDIVMPEGEGIQLLLDLKKEFPATPVIVMTGGSGTKDYSYIAMGLGARHILHKPFSVDELVMTVHAALAGELR
jgi:DNA-binding NtrC family response regulator